MHPARILAELKVKGVSYKDIAQRCEVSVTAFYNTFCHSQMTFEKKNTRI